MKHSNKFSNIVVSTMIIFFASWSHASEQRAPSALEGWRCTIKKEFKVESNSGSCASDEFAKNSCVEETLDDCAHLETGEVLVTLQESHHSHCTSAIHTCN